MGARIPLPVDERLTREQRVGGNTQTVIAMGGAIRREIDNGRVKAAALLARSQVRRAPLERRTLVAKQYTDRFPQLAGYNLTDTLHAGQGIKSGTRARTR